MFGQRALLSEDIVSCPLRQNYREILSVSHECKCSILIPGWIRKKKKNVMSLVVCHVPEALLICSSNETTFSTMAVTGATSW